eukprot:symbB.v1.2.008148.t1/scaffold509.1/size193965/18
MSLWLVQVVITASCVLVHLNAQKVPECQGTMMSCDQEGAKDDPCSLSESCLKTFHTCPKKGAFRQCERDAEKCVAGNGCYIRCWGRKVEFSSCAEVPIESCQDSYVVDDNGNGMHCMLKTHSECVDRLSCFSPGSEM